MAEQPAGLVVRVTVGQGMGVVVVVVRMGGSVTTLVTTPVAVGVVLVVVVLLVVVDRRVVGRQRRVDDEVVVGAAHVSWAVRNSMSQPWYGHAASQGAISVAVGMAVGQPHGLRIVVVKLQSVKGHSLPHPRFWIVFVAVGQMTDSWAHARPARLRRAGRASFIVTGVLFDDCRVGVSGFGEWFSPYSASTDLGVQWLRQSSLCRRD